MSASAENGSTTSPVAVGRHAQRLDLRPEHLAHVGEQSRLLDRLTPILLPAVDAHRHDRHVREVDQRAGP